MWTSTLELDPARVILTRILGRFWPGAYFSSFAPFQVQNIPRQPLLASNWVRVRNTLAGVCGSDLHMVFVDGELGIAPAALPQHGRSYLGHEVVGEVIEAGDDVQDIHVGDRVVIQHGPNCLSTGVTPPCRFCARGYYNLCENGNLPSPKPVGGGWSEEMLLHEQQLFRVPDSLSDEQAVLLEPTAVALHATLRHLPSPGDKVLIIGAGTIGLLMLQMLKALAPDTEISVLARHAFQVEQATRMGAKHIIYPQDSYRGVQQATGATLYHGVPGNKLLMGGYDVIYDTVGTARTTHDALRWTRAGGTVVMIGVYLHKMQIDLSPVWYQEVNLIGSMGHGMEQWPIGSNEQKSTFEAVTELMEQGRIHPEQFITHRFALTDYRDALLTALHKNQNRATKVIFDYSLQPASVVPNVRATRKRRLMPFGIRPTPLYEQDEHEGIEEEAPVTTTTASTGVPATPAPLSPRQSEHDDDVQTVVVAKPKFGTHPVQPVPDYIDPTQTSRSESEVQDTLLPPPPEEDVQTVVVKKPAYDPHHLLAEDVASTELVSPGETDGEDTIRTASVHIHEPEQQQVDEFVTPEAALQEADSTEDNWQSTSSRDEASREQELEAIYEARTIDIPTSLADVPAEPATESSTEPEEEQVLVPDEEYAPMVWDDINQDATATPDWLSSLHIIGGQAPYATSSEETPVNTEADAPDDQASVTKDDASALQDIETETPAPSRSASQSTQARKVRKRKR